MIYSLLYIVDCTDLTQNWKMNLLQTICPHSCIDDSLLCLFCSKLCLFNLEGLDEILAVLLQLFRSKVMAAFGSKMHTRPSSIARVSCTHMNVKLTSLQQYFS